MPQQAPLPRVVRELATQPRVVNVEPERHALILGVQGEGVELREIGCEPRIGKQPSGEICVLHPGQARRLAAANCEEVAVSAVDEPLRRVVLAQLAEPKAHGPPVSQVSAHLLETPPRLGERDAGKDAQKLVAADPHQEVI